MSDNSAKALWIGGAIKGTHYKIGDETTFSTNVDDLRESNFTDLFIWSGMNTNLLPMKTATKFYLQIGTVNCVYYDIETDTVSWNTKDDGYEEVPILVNHVEGIMTKPSTIENISIMLGGGSYNTNRGPVYNKTFINLQVLIDPSAAPELPAGFDTSKAGTGKDSIIYRMFDCLKEHLPQITGVQYDEEYKRLHSTNNLFSDMLIGDHFKYGLSYIPFTDESFWKVSVKKYLDHLTGVYLQTYFSGNSADTAFRFWKNWKGYLSQKKSKDEDKMISILRPVVMEAVNGGSAQCPENIVVEMSKFKGSGATGAGLWLYDDVRKAQLNQLISPCQELIPNIQNYAAALEIPTD